MSPRAAWQLEQYGFGDVYDFVVGKVHWLASARPTERSDPADRVVDHLDRALLVVEHAAIGGDVRRRISAGHDSQIIVVNDDQVVVGVLQAEVLDGIDPDRAIADVMSTGPTTIRPHEDAAAVRGRMERRGVRSIIVTTPTGRFLGLFHHGSS